MTNNERCYRFPSSLQLERFMNSFGNWTGYDVEGFYSANSKSGSMTVVQALPFMQARVPWRISGSTVYFDLTYVLMHFNEFKTKKILEHMLNQANLFGAGITGTGIY